MAQDPLVDALGALSRFVVSDASLGDTLHRVAEITLDAVPAAGTVGISMFREGQRPTTAIYTDERAPDVDASQYESGRGPCLDAGRQQRVVYVEDMVDAADTYPEFAKASLDHDVHSTLSLPLVATDQSLGALNLYAGKPKAFSDDDQQVAGQLAATAAAVLANAEAYWRVFELSEHLSEAMKTRATIEQAKGVLMAQSPDVGPDEAFDLLRKASQRENVKLREIAERIIERRRPRDR